MSLANVRWNVSILIIVSSVVRQCWVVDNSSWMNKCLLCMLFLDPFSARFSLMSVKVCKSLRRGDLSERSALVPELFSTSALGECFWGWFSPMLGLSRRTWGSWDWGTRPVALWSCSRVIPWLLSCSAMGPSSTGSSFPGEPSDHCSGSSC